MEVAVSGLDVERVVSSHAVMVLEIWIAGNWGMRWKGRRIVVVVSREIRKRLGRLRHLVHKGSVGIHGVQSRTTTKRTVTTVCFVVSKVSR